MLGGASAAVDANQLWGERHGLCTMSQLGCLTAAMSLTRSVVEEGARPGPHNANYLSGNSTSRDSSM
jgi:hypothetical protein